MQEQGPSARPTGKQDDAEECRDAKDAPEEEPVSPKKDENQKVHELKKAVVDQGCLACSNNRHDRTCESLSYLHVSLMLPHFILVYCR